MTGLTAAQARALRTLDALVTEQGRAVHARAFAEALWPDSPAWERRPYRHGASKGAGTAPHGGTMPLLAGSMLARLQARGCVTDDDGAWRLTVLGVRVLAGQADPLPPPSAPPPYRSGGRKPPRRSR